MHKNGDLQFCQRCGGILELQGGTDPEKAKKQRVWTEKYECVSCGSIGHYHVDERHNQISETFSGVCADYNA